MHELTIVLAASSVRYWRMELMHLISMYAALHVLMMSSFIERSLSKMKLKLWMVPVNSTSVLLREIVYGYCKVVLAEDIVYGYCKVVLAEDIVYGYCKVVLAEDIVYGYCKVVLAEDIVCGYCKVVLTEDDLTQS